MTYVRSLVAVLTGWAAFVLVTSSRAVADDGDIVQTGNVKFVYSIIEPRPKQYQLYIKSIQLDPRRSCSLFIAHIRTNDGVERTSGKLDSVASFLLDPTDFNVHVWLTDVRIAYWDEWYQSNAARNRQGYGNPCLATTGSSMAESESREISLPKNRDMPCDSVSFHAPGRVNAVQHIAIAFESLRIEVTQPDSNLVYTAKLSDIDQTSFRIMEIDGLYNLRFWTVAGQIFSEDRKGHKFTGNANEMQLVCPTREDAETIQNRFLRR